MGAATYGVRVTETPTSLPPPGTEDVLYVIDLSGYVYRAYHAIAPLSSSKGEVTHAVLGTVNMIQKVVNERRPAMLAVAMDCKGPSFRKDLDPRYKATRQAMPLDLRPQIERCEAIVRAYNIPIFRADGIEADDLIAALVARAVAEGLRVVGVSADKDLMQLVHDTDDRVILWDSMRDRAFGAGEVTSKFGVPPSQLRDLLALTGDTSDNIPGVPSVGPKTAADLLTSYGSLEGVYANLSTIKRAKLRENLEAHEADARLSQTLVTLKADVPITFDIEHLRYGGADIEALRALFAELEFTRLLGQLPAPTQGERGPAAPNASIANAGDEAFGDARADGNRATLSCKTVLTRADLDALVAEAKACGVLGLGVVTSVSDPMRAHLVGVALAVGPAEGVYVPLAHRYIGAPKQLSLDEVRGPLGTLLEDTSVRKVGYDCKRIEDVLARHGMRIAGEISDPMLAAYLLDPEQPHELSDLTRRVLQLDLPTFD